MLRVFENNQLNLKMQMLTVGNQHYFKAKEVAQSLGYERHRSALDNHVSKDYKIRLGNLKGAQKLGSLNAQPHSLYITEPGLYELVFGSHLPAAKEFKRWVFEEVLPTIRKTGQFKAYNAQMFKIENEFDLHRKVVDYIRRFYPQLLFIAGLGELQDTSDKRIKSWQKGYQKGQPDLIITSHHKKYNGFCLEFKTPTGKGTLSDAQSQQLEKYAYNGYKILVRNDYDVITREISEYCRDVRLPCQYCPKKFRTAVSLRGHTQGFHKISPEYNDRR